MSQEQEQQNEVYAPREPYFLYGPIARDLNERWHARRRARAWARYCEAHTEQLVA